MTTVTTRVGNLVIPKPPETELILSTSHSGANTISFTALDGLNCGVPTRTTPTITPVTPTTLCENLDRSLMSTYQLENESHHNEAGFVPPLVQPLTSDSNNSSLSVSTTYTNDGNGTRMHMNIVDTKMWQGGSMTTSDLPPLLHLNDNHHSGSVSPPIPPHVIAIGSSSGNSSSSSSSSGRKNIGGRRPNKSSGISPEEEHRRNLRRERNKQAAARCRKRRMDHTNQLVLETEDLERRKMELAEQVTKFQEEVNKLRELLDTHECKIPLDSPEDVKPFVLNPELSQMMMNNEKRIKMEPRNYSSEECTITPHLSSNSTLPTSINPGMTGNMKRRPDYLPVTTSFLSKTLGVSITTPSADFMDAFLQEGGTGLTPITSAISSASCSTQLRSSTGMDLSSPDANNVTKLVSL